MRQNYERNPEPQREKMRQSYESNLEPQRERKKGICEQH